MNLKFWNWHLGADKIIGRFDRGEMSNKEKFKFFFIVVLFLTVLIEVSAWFGAEFSLEYLNLDKLNSLIYMAVTAFGTLYLFKKHTEGTSFIEKYIIATVASFFTVLIVIAIPTIFLMYFLAGMYEGFSGTEFLAEDKTIWFDLLVNFMVGVLAYWKLGTYFK